MKIINFGSLNIDHVYTVPHFVQKGETISSMEYQTFCGGKGLNQSVAAARAGGEIFHAGMIGRNGEALQSMLMGAGIDLRYLREIDGVCGHAIIQVTPEGQNCIIIHSGANGAVTAQYVRTLAKELHPGDYVMLQNEMKMLPLMIELANEAGACVVLNPSPITEELMNCPLRLVDVFVLNEIEGAALSGIKSRDAQDILKAMGELYPNAEIVLTAGKQGAWYQKADQIIHHGIYDVEVADTTGAGDTFCGYFTAGRAQGLPPEEIMRRASVASSIAVSRRGAALSIPTLEEVLNSRLLPL